MNFFEETTNDNEDEKKKNLQLLTKKKKAPRIENENSSVFESSVPEIDMKEELFKNMESLKNMSVQENVFYRKYKEIQSYNKNLDFISNLLSVKNKIWTPTDIFNVDLTIQEIENLNPKVLYVDPSSQDLMSDWLSLRLFCHTMEFDQNPGRFLRFLIVHDTGIDDLSGDRYKYLGATSIASDVISLGPREEFIGWTQEDRIDRDKLRNSAIGSCIMPTQPFGYNFIGGKLVACLTCGETVQQTWKSIYGDTLVGMTTTSLYGTGSMYDGMPKYWKGVGESAGKVAIKPDEDLYNYWHDQIKILHPEEYDKKMTQKEDVSGPVTGAKQRVVNMIFKEVGIKSSDYQHGYKRGVYYNMLYENGKEFFQSKIEESSLIKKSHWKSDSDIINWWKKKAINRYKNLHQSNRLNPDILFYDKMIGFGIQYQDVKKIYFSDVGR